MFENIEKEEGNFTQKRSVVLNLSKCSHKYFAIIPSGTQCRCQYCTIFKIKLFFF